MEDRTSDGSIPSARDDGDVLVRPSFLLSMALLRVDWILSTDNPGTKHDTVGRMSSNAAWRCSGIIFSYLSRTPCVLQT